MNTPADKESFLHLIEHNKGIIFKVCHSYCINKSEREDLAQEIIYHLWKSYHSYDSNFKFTTWMYRVALNTAISFYRKEKKAYSLVPLSEHLIEIEDEKEDAAGTEENIRLLQQFIYRLKELDRALMILYLENKPYKEIAEILGITETNIATKISRIKDKLKQKFATLKK